MRYQRRKQFRAARPLWHHLAQSLLGAGDPRFSPSRRLARPGCISNAEGQRRIWRRRTRHRRFESPLRWGGRPLKRRTRPPSPRVDIPAAEFTPPRRRGGARPSRMYPDPLLVKCQHTLSKRRRCGGLRCYIPVSFEDHVNDDGIVFCRVQPRGCYYAHSVHTTEFDESDSDNTGT